MTELDEVLEHDYDGIREYDNHLPMWWLITLYGSIVFGGIYWAYFHGLDVGRSQMEQYAFEMEEAEAALKAREAAEQEKNPLTADRLVAMSKDAEVVTRGAQVWSTTCLACHGPTGAGTVGPNLTDAYWLHGGDPLAILKIVEHGVVTKGMPAWKPVLGVTKTREVAAYVLTMKGKNLPGKPPQGDKDG